MGKKSSSNGGGGEKSKAAKAFVLKVAMHCRCKGCIHKIRNAVNGLAQLHGVEAMDQSALLTKGEVSLVASADPEKLRQRLRKATRKNVELLLPKAEAKPADKKERLAADKKAQALVLNSLPAQYGGQGAWANQLLAGGGWNTGNYGEAQAYPWDVQPAEAYSYTTSSYPAAAGWGPYAYPPPAQGHCHGAYGGASAWHAHGY